MDDQRKNSISDGPGRSLAFRHETIVEGDSVLMGHDLLEEIRQLFGFAHIDVRRDVHGTTVHAQVGNFVASARVEASMVRAIGPSGAWTYVLLYLAAKHGLADDLQGKRATLEALLEAGMPTIASPAGSVQP